jgi:uncharacterized Zn-binding protein involved in type VI secretion
MPKVARKNGVDSVSTNHGCDGSTSTSQGSSNVFANSIGVVRVGDLNQTHRVSGRNCSNSHAVPLSSGSPNVFANNKAVGRIGDVYGGSENITSGSPNVFANG